MDNKIEFTGPWFSALPIPIDRDEEMLKAELEAHGYKYTAPMREQ